MARPTLHHPAVQFAIPLIVGIACYRGGEMVRTYVDNLPVLSAPIQASSPALPRMTLPTVYIAGHISSSPAGAADLNGLFRNNPEAPPVEPLLAPPGTDGQVVPAAPEQSRLAPAPVLTLCEQMALVSVDGVTGSGVFIDGVFYRFNDRLVTAAGVSEPDSVSPTVVGIVKGKVRIKSGKETCDVEFEH